jgi:hypothetical protein
MGKIKEWLIVAGTVLFCLLALVATVYIEYETRWGSTERLEKRIEVLEEIHNIGEDVE